MRRSSRLGGIARRDLLRLGFGSLALSASGNLERSPFWAQAAAATREGRILVVVELSGGNDGLNTVVPFADVWLAAGGAFILALPYLWNNAAYAAVTSIAVIVVSFALLVAIDQAKQRRR